MPNSLITIAKARELVLETVAPLPSEQVAIDDGLNRVLAADVRATANVPPFASSAMDGYAVIAGEAGRVLTVVGESRAGSPSDHRLVDGEAVRISTGGALPAGATAVIPQEQVSVDGTTIETLSAVSPRQSVREPGEDIGADTLVLPAGTGLGAVELGAATGAGVGVLTVARRPRVSVLCTGDELRAPGEPLGPGEIHNSNAPMLTGLAHNAGASTAPAGRLPDDREATRAGIAQ